MRFDSSMAPRASSLRHPLADVVAEMKGYGATTLVAEVRAGHSTLLEVMTREESDVAL